MGAGRRRQRTTRLTERADIGWERTLAEHGITWTALTEALGELLAGGHDWLPPEAVARARRIDRERYTRRERGDDPPLP